LEEKTMISKTPQQQESFYQHTLKDSFTCIGVGLHTGLKIIMTVMPANANTGYRFIRRDLPARYNEVLASWHTVTDTHLSTTVANNTGVRVSTIEHLIAALSASGVDNAQIVLDGPEVPIMDGSARPFVQLIESVGRERLSEERKVILIKHPVTVMHGDKCASLVPSPEPWIDMFIDFDSAAIGQQRLTIPLSRKIFKEELADARTFGFSEQIEILKKLGFARGGSLQNAILVDKNGVVNEGGLRYTDEFVRHKVLDSIGDLALSGAYIVGCYRAKFAGHRLNNELLHALMRDENAFEYIPLRDANQRYFSNIEFENQQQMSFT
jgi:UDP-3-O-[3-hydroxymyristoyl] N-acetylglucosamine deacetylase